MQMFGFMVIRKSKSNGEYPYVAFFIKDEMEISRRLDSDLEKDDLIIPIREAKKVVDWPTKYTTTNTEQIPI